MNTNILPQPTDPEEALDACYRYLERACQMLRDAITEEEQTLASYFIKSANGEIARWQARKVEAAR